MGRPGLIFDVGFHRGEDTEFYLKRGFKVIAVEANPELAAAGGERFADAIAEGRLVIVNKALARESGEVTFYVSDLSVWGTLDPLWAERNARMGAASRPTTVLATTMAALLEEFGVPHYVKFDIEGFDMVGVEGLAHIPQSERPAYVSVESEKNSFNRLRAEIATFVSLGYDRFKAVPQSKVSAQPCADHQFAEGASGCFGEEAPGRWLTADEVIDAYKPIFWRYALVGDDPVAPRWARSIAWRTGLRADWYDTHAKRS